jgi:CDP-glucose 4,6-dehydratase
MEMNVDFWQGKRVLVTGHTGFKGSWLCLLLERLGAIVIGYSRKPESQPNLYDMACVEKGITSIIGELSDDELLQSSFAKYKPEIVLLHRH